MSIDTPETYLLISLGRDVDGGYSKLARGIDCDAVGSDYKHADSVKYEGACATVGLDVKYMVAVTTPCVVLCRAKMVRE